MSKEGEREMRNEVTHDLQIYGLAYMNITQM